MGSGNGHGVGMSQWAAQAMAQDGKSYREILLNFYPGTQIAQQDDARQDEELSGTERGTVDLPAVSLARESSGSEKKRDTRGKP